MDLMRLICGCFFIHLLILQVFQVFQQCVAKEMDGKNWSKMTFKDEKFDQVQIDFPKLDDNAPHILRSGSVPKEANVLRLPSMDFQEENDRKGSHIELHVHQHVHSHSLSHVDNMDPSVIVFFTLNDLKLGKTMQIYFPDRDLSSSNFLPREEADAIPFSSKELPNLFQIFSFSQGSPQAIAMENTLKECEMKPIIGETKLCVTSIASMLDFAHDIFGLDHKIKVLSTIHRTPFIATLQKYTITEVPEVISASKMIACHTMPYPYGVFYCHYQETESQVYRIPLVGEHGDKIEAIAVCHMDTSQWSRNHISFSVLGIEPGSQSVCHFFPADNLVLVTST